MWLFKSVVGKKIIMAVTGILMFIFVLIHLAGNMTIFSGWINAYGEHLHAFPLMVWAARAALIPIFLLHVFMGIHLTLQNNNARPQAYVMKQNLRATFSGRTMIWTGLVLLGFILYHLLHFSFQIIYPEFAANLPANKDALGRPDVFKMIVSGFQQIPLAGLYVVGLIVLGLHLRHGVQSVFQSIGLNSEKSLPVFDRISIVGSVVILIGYASIPVAIFLGWISL
ncbi:MAG: succinate dehydrogenase cytochrome b subunit [Nitrospirota bacterium]